MVTEILYEWFIVKDTLQGTSMDDVKLQCSMCHNYLICCILFIKDRLQCSSVHKYAHILLFSYIYCLPLSEKIIEKNKHSDHSVKFISKYGILDIQFEQHVYILFKTQIKMISMYISIQKMTE